MATQIVRDCFYEFKDEKETLSAQLLSEGNIQYIKTQLSFERSRLLNLVPSPDSYAMFVQDHAAITGAIGAYEFLLNNHEDVIKRLSAE